LPYRHNFSPDSLYLIAAPYTPPPNSLTTLDGGVISEYLSSDIRIFVRYESEFRATNAAFSAVKRKKTAFRIFRSEYEKNLFALYGKKFNACLSSRNSDS
jgi:hypothetical protein